MRVAPLREVNVEWGEGRECRENGKGKLENKEIGGKSVKDKKKKDS